SATYHGDLMQGMKTLLFLAEKAQLEGKIGAAFGAFGWSGEAPGRIYGTMENIFKMKMVKEPLMLKSSSLGGGLQMAQDYGRQVAKMMASS
ncbi:MAG: nitric oxide synthase, partial [Desulfobacterales bacterium]